jgi:hypothetical protein
VTRVSRGSDGMRPCGKLTSPRPAIQPLLEPCTPRLGRTSECRRRYTRLRLDHQLHHPWITGGRLHAVVHLSLWSLLQLPHLCWLYRMAPHPRRANVAVSIQLGQGGPANQHNRIVLSERPVGFLVLSNGTAPNCSELQLDYSGLWGGRGMVLDVLFRLGKEGVPRAGGVCSQGRVNPSVNSYYYSIVSVELFALRQCIISEDEYSNGEFSGPSAQLGIQDDAQSQSVRIAMTACLLINAFLFGPWVQRSNSFPVIFLHWQFLRHAASQRSRGAKKLTANAVIKTRETSTDSLQSNRPRIFLRALGCAHGPGKSLLIHMAWLPMQDKRSATFS